MFPQVLQSIMDTRHREFLAREDTPPYDYLSACKRWAGFAYTPLTDCECCRLKRTHQKKEASGRRHFKINFIALVEGICPHLLDADTREGTAAEHIHATPHIPIIDEEDEDENSELDDAGDVQECPACEKPLDKVALCMLEPLH